jgi:nitrite reductase/ring-hydroxylating ferredoxin subunit
MEKQSIARVAEVPEGSAKEFTYRGQPAILAHCDGEFHAFVNICTHEYGQCLLTGEVLTCQLHGSTFDPKTGKALSEPAPPDSHLIKIPITIQNGEIRSQ